MTTGLVGSKQPQDFGGNANFGGRFGVEATGPLDPGSNLFWHFGTALTASGNAVQVFELLGENSGRVQSYSTIGVFSRFENGTSFALNYDYLYQESYDNFDLMQFRVRLAKQITWNNEIGITAHVPTSGDGGQFNNIKVDLRPIAQGSFFLRHRWESQTETTAWIGVASGHGEDNVLTGPGLQQDHPLVFGADIYAPLNRCLAIYGEANFMTPVDTGVVDAFLGFQWSMRGAVNARRRRGSPVLPLACNSSMSIDLKQR